MGRLVTDLRLLRGADGLATVVVTIEGDPTTDDGAGSVKSDAPTY